MMADESRKTLTAAIRIACAKENFSDEQRRAVELALLEHLGEAIARQKMVRVRYKLRERRAELEARMEEIRAKKPGGRHKGLLETLLQGEFKDFPILERKVQRLDEYHRMEQEIKAHDARVRREFERMT